MMTFAINLQGSQWVDTTNLAKLHINLQLTIEEHRNGLIQQLFAKQIDNFMDSPIFCNNEILIHATTDLIQIGTN
jgi:hypothetical protein